LFGDAQVFLDKDDLRGGVRWSDEIARTIETRPVLLLLLTPQLLAATDDRGRLRIANPDDPVRREVTAAPGSRGASRAAAVRRARDTTASRRIAGTIRTASATSAGCRCAPTTGKTTSSVW
jgi:hypothetical protein